MDERPTRPCPQMLVATTMALMTAFANPNPAASVPAATQRLLMARKIVSNLFFLKEHPGLGAPLREVFVSAHTLWSALAKHLEGDRQAPSADVSDPDTRVGTPGGTAPRWVH